MSSGPRRQLAADARTAPLGEAVDAGTEVLAGDPRARVLDLGGLAGAEVGVWEMTPGSVRDVEADEVFVVLSGAGTVRFEDGEEVALGPGAVVRLRAGERTEWTVTETLRKVYLSA